jgi:hypothetical protein
MVRGSYSPPSQVTTGSIQGRDSDGDTGLTISDGVCGLRTDGVQQLKATTAGVTMRVPFVAIDSADSPFTMNIDDHLVLVDTTNGSVEISLPSAVTAASRKFIIKDKGNASTNNITVTAAAGNIDGFGSITISNSFANLPVMSDGSNFWVID